MSQASPNGIRSFLTWVWGAILILGGGFYLALTTGAIPYEGPLIPVVAGAVALISLPFLARAAIRQEGWALLVAWIFLALGLLLGAMYLLAGYELFILVVLLAEIAVPLLAAYFQHRDRWGLLLAGYAAVSLGLLVSLMALQGSLLSIGGFALLLTAIPFAVIYWVNRQHWWAIIPAGLLGLAAVVVLVFFALLEPGTPLFFIVLNATLAAVFFAVWLMFRQLDLAAWISAGFAGAAVLSYWVPSTTNWAVLALVMGGYIVYRQIRGARSRLSAPAASAPASPPPAAQPTTPVPSTTPSTPPAPPPSPSVSGPPPGVEFRPIDPFKSRKPDDQ